MELGEPFWGWSIQYPSANKAAFGGEYRRKEKRACSVHVLEQAASFIFILFMYIQDTSSVPQGLNRRF